MSRSNVFTNQIMGLIYNGTAIPDLAQNDTTAPAIVLTFALHTASPGVGGDQSMNETTYPGYGRISVNRNSSGWTIAQNTVLLENVVTFAVASGPADTLTHFSVGTGFSDAMLYFGPLSENIPIFASVQPQLSTSLIIREEPGNLLYSEGPGNYNDMPGIYNEA